MKRTAQTAGFSGDLSELSDQGYISEMSSLLISRNNNKYFKGKLELKHKVQRFVCYTPEKHLDYETAHKLGSPIQLSNFKLIPSLNEKDTLDIQINKLTKMSIIKKLDFQKKTEPNPTSSGHGQMRNVVVTSLKDIDTSTTHVMVSLNPKYHNMTTKIV